MDLDIYCVSVCWSYRLYWWSSYLIFVSWFLTRPYGFLITFWVPALTKCSRLILQISCLTSRINHLLKEPWLCLLKTGIFRQQSRHWDSHRHWVVHCFLAASVDRNRIYIYFFNFKINYSMNSYYFQLKFRTTGFFYLNIVELTSLSSLSSADIPSSQWQQHN